MIKDRMGNTVTKTEIYNVLSYLKNGADVYDLNMVRIIRAIDENEITHGLVHIVPLNELSEITGIDYDGAKQLPYFGAITSGVGEMWLHRVIVLN